MRPQGPPRRANAWWLTVALAAVVTVSCSRADGNEQLSPPPTTAAGAETSGNSEPPDRFDDIGAVTVEEPEQPDLIDDRVRAEADELREAVERAAREQPWGDAAGARAAGYVQMPGDPLHWYDPEAVARMGDIDPERPDFVMIDDGQVLGVMFLAPSDDGSEQPPPVPGAPLVRWHLHRWSEPVCLGVGEMVVVDVPSADGACPGEAVAARHSPWMFHVWLVGDDPFSAEMHPPGHDH